MRVRWATDADVDELVRLRRVMFESMGDELRDDIGAGVAAALRRGLGDGSFFAAVADADTNGPGDGHLAACGIGMVAQRVPGPGNPTGRWGYIQSMVTDERCRREGHARRILEALLERFVAEGVTSVELHATPEGEPLYRSVGFVHGRQPGLVWTAG